MKALEIAYTYILGTPFSTKLAFIPGLLLETYDVLVGPLIGSWTCAAVSPQVLKFTEDTCDCLTSLTKERFDATTLLIPRYIPRETSTSSQRHYVSPHSTHDAADVPASPVKGRKRMYSVLHSVGAKALWSGCAQRSVSFESLSHHRHRHPEADSDLHRGTQQALGQVAQLPPWSMGKLL
jgi:hypothetical protein